MMQAFPGRRSATQAMYYYIFGKVTTLSSPSPNIGTDSGEGSGDRADFDDVDDYHSWSASPPEGKNGTSLVGYDGWTRSVNVVYVTAAQPGGLSVVGDLGVKRITVTVTDPRGASTTVIGVRSKMGAHEQDVSATRTYVSWVGLDLQIGEAKRGLDDGGCAGQ